jgi:hypothetical protein
LESRLGHAQYSPRQRKYVQYGPLPPYGIIHSEAACSPTVVDRKLEKTKENISADDVAVVTPRTVLKRLNNDAAEEEEDGTADFSRTSRRRQLDESAGFRPQPFVPHELDFDDQCSKYKKTAAWFLGPKAGSDICKHRLEGSIETGQRVSQYIVQADLK